MLIDDIIIGDRFRKDAGDIPALAKSIDANGLMHLPVVTTTNELVCGYRRLLAAESLGWTEIDVRVIDPQDLLLAEHDENECRKQFTPSERVAIADAIRLKTRGSKGGHMATPPSEKPRAAAAKAAGFDSEQEYRRAKKVVETAEPELVEAMDSGSVPVATAEKASKLPPKKQREIAKSKNPKKAAQEAVKEAKEPEVILPTAVDAWGIPIQEHAIEVFAAVPKFKELASAISIAQKLFNEVANLPGGKFLQLPEVSSYRRGKKTGDGIYEDRFVHTGLENALQHVKNATPTHTICPWHYVDGKHPEKCTTCHGQNWTPVLGSNIPDMAKERARKKFKVKEADDV